MTAPDRYSDAFMVILKKGGGIEASDTLRARIAKKVTVCHSMGIWLYGSFRANMKSSRKINLGGRYENGFIYKIDRQ